MGCCITHQMRTATSTCRASSTPAGPPTAWASSSGADQLLLGGGPPAGGLAGFSNPLAFMQVSMALKLGRPSLLLPAEAEHSLRAASSAGLLPGPPLGGGLLSACARPSVAKRVSASAVCFMTGVDPDSSGAAKTRLQNSTDAVSTFGEPGVNPGTRFGHKPAVIDPFLHTTGQTRSLTFMPVKKRVVRLQSLMPSAISLAD